MKITQLLIFFVLLSTTVYAEYNSDSPDRWGGMTKQILEYVNTPTVLRKKIQDLELKVAVLESRIDSEQKMSGQILESQRHNYLISVGVVMFVAVGMVSINFMLINQSNGRRDKN